VGERSIFIPVAVGVEASEGNGKGIPKRG